MDQIPQQYSQPVPQEAPQLIPHQPLKKHHYWILIVVAILIVIFAIYYFSSKQQTGPLTEDQKVNLLKDFNQTNTVNISQQEKQNILNSLSSTGSNK
jgi:flagellar basal body-associated protein FliL